MRHVALLHPHGTVRQPLRPRSESQSHQPPPADISIPKTKLSDTNAADGQDCSKGNMAQVFRKNGWKTGVVGKWHLSDESTFDQVKIDVQSCGFNDTEAMYPDNFDATTPWIAAHNTHHNMEYVAYKAVEFIQDNRNSDWFLYMNPTAPHGPSVDAALDIDCRSTVDGDFRDPAHPEHPGAGWNVPAMTEAYGGNCTAYRGSVRARAGSNSDADLGSIWVDDAIGAVYTALERTGQLQNTVIVFQLDHGMANKDEIWEGGVRIPQFVHYPAAIPAPKSFDGMVSTIDIAPTFLEIAGIDDANPHWYPMDGKSWLTAIDDAAAAADWKANRCLFFENSFERAVRCGCDKYIQLSAGSTELATAVAQGWSGYDAATTEVYADLCNHSPNYIVAENNPNLYGPEADNEAAQEPQKVADLRSLLECHMTRTGQMGTLMDKNDPPLYSDCVATGIATPSPTVTHEPTLPVASGDVPELLDNDPLLDDIRDTHSAQVLQATVLTPDINRVRFSVLYPNGTVTGFGEAATEVSRSGHQSVHEVTIDTTGQPGMYGYRIRIDDHNDNQVTVPDDFIEFFVADTPKDLLECARGRIAALCDAEQGLAAKFVRHGFHDCVGGCDGCVNLEDADNAGLDIPIDRLAPVVDLFAIEGITRADIWVLAALEGARGAQPTPDPGYNVDFAMEWHGRPTCETQGYIAVTDCQNGVCNATLGPIGEDFNLPSPNLNTHELLDFFAGAFNFTTDETVAIMGAHSLGVLARENSGYDGPDGWKAGNRVMDNGYYQNLAGGDAADAPVDEATLLDAPRWTQAFVDNSAFATPDRFQWERNGFVMINSDIALIRDFSGAGDLDASTGEVHCAFKCTRANGCPRDPACPMAAATIRIVETYKHEPDTFIEDFEAAFKKMLAHGAYDTDSVPCLVGPCEVLVSGRRNLRGAGN